MAVRLDIRPRLRLAPDWEPGRATRRRFRLPALALPAAGYWAAMAALTYAFTQLGPHPLDEAFAAEPPSTPEPRPAAPSPAAPTEPTAEPSPVAESTPGEAPEPAPREPLPPAEVEPSIEAEAAPLNPPARDAQRERRELEEPPAPRPRAAPPSSTFPEFTDSSAPRPRERAADGPRIDSLFERADVAPPPTGEPGEAPAERAPRPVIALSSCEAAVAKNGEQLEIGGPRGPADITREAYASILQNGSYLSSCRIPERTVFEICAAVKEGRAVGVTVTSTPPSAELVACVRRAVAGLSFPHRDRLDVTHTRFDAVRR